jgi:hypothetical protein
MRSINVDTYKQMIRHVAVRLDQPIYVSGPPGIAKSQAAAQVCDEDGMFHCDIRVSQYEGIDFRGLPDLSDGRTRWNLPLTLPFIGNDAFPDDRIILLTFDEMNSAQDDGVLAVLYQAVSERRVGEHIFKPNVRIMGMGNRDTDKGITRRIPTPLANRFTHAEMVIDEEAVVNYFLSKGYPRIACGFLMFRKPLVSTFDPSSPSRVFASPRTWEKALTYHMDQTMPLDVQQAAISGAIGEGPASEFNAYLQMAGKIVPTSAIIKDPKGVPLPEDEGMCWAMTMSVSGDMDKTNVGPLTTYLTRIADTSRFGPEYVISAWQLALKRNDDLYTTKEYLAFAKAYRSAFSGK